MWPPIRKNINLVASSRPRLGSLLGNDGATEMVFGLLDGGDDGE